MLKFTILLVDSLAHFLVDVPDADRENATEKIQILFAVSIKNRMILGVVDDQWLVVIRSDARKQIFFLLIENLFLVHYNSLTQLAQPHCR